MEYSHIHLDSVQDIVGFVVENTKGPDPVRVLARALLTSDEPEFYTYIDHITDLFFTGDAHGNKFVVFKDAVFQFLVIIHADLSSDLYINNFKVVTEVKARRDLQKGEI